MLLRRTFVPCLAILGLAVTFVTNAHAQPDPFQPLKPKKKAIETKAAEIVPPAKYVSLVAESEADSAQREKITAALDSPTTLDFLEAPLSDVVAFLRELHKIPIVLDPRAMDDVGMADDVPVTINLAEISLRSALRLMLRDLELTYVMADGVLQITTIESAESRLIQHVYPVGDLADPNTTGTGRLNHLSELITQTIAASGWDAQGGPGVIVPLDHLGVLVISQTTDVHEQIAALIVTLRRVREMQAE